MHKSCLEDYKMIHIYFYHQIFEVKTANSERLFMS